MSISNYNPPKVGQLIDTSWIDRMQDENREEAERKDREAEQALKDDANRKAASLFEASGVPERHKHAKPGKDGSWGMAWSKIEPLLGQGAIIPIVGTRGSGKTQLAVEAVRHVCRLHRPCLYTKAMGVFLDIRDGMKTKDKSEREAIQALIKPSLLVIDAMEVRGETDFENRVLDYLVDLRYDEGLDTILISNQTRKEFGESLGLSIISRIHESGDIVECSWESFRKRQP